MYRILFQDGKSYELPALEASIERIENNDRWGNSNIRRNNRYWSVEQALERIAPELCLTAAAAEIDGELLPLETSITNDCALKIITVHDEQGRYLLRRTAGFFTAKAVWELTKGRVRFAAIDLADGQFRIDASEADDITAQAIIDLLAQYREQGLTPKVYEGLQKELVLENYPCIVQPYINEEIEQLDDYETLPFVGCGDFALYTAESIYLPMTKLPSDIKISCRKEGGLLKITGQL